MATQPAYGLADLSVLEREAKRRLWFARPDVWCRERAKKTIWSIQRQIMESVRDNRKTAVQSCHGAGKSFDAALLVCWWEDCHSPGDAKVVTSAPTNPQVKGVLWQYIRDIHAEAGLYGRTNTTEWLMEVRKPNGKVVELQVAFGRKPANLNPAAFQGYHAAAMLVIFDEADGIPRALYNAAQGLMSNDDCRILAIGNPDNPDSHFAVVCKPGSGWLVIVISVFDTPNFTGEDVPDFLKKKLVDHVYVEEAIKDWAPGWSWNEDRTKVVPPNGASFEDALKDVDPCWCSKVLGIFPKVGGPLVLIPDYWIKEAQERTLKPGFPVELGCDVGGGGDSSTTCLRRGQVFRVVSEDKNPNTMETCGKIKGELEKYGAVKAKVDSVGIGAGVVDRGREQGLPYEAVNVGMASSNPEKYANLRAEFWWGVREMFQDGLVDIDAKDDKLARELGKMRFRRNSKNQIVVESKLDAMKRGVPSPNRADALMMAANEPPVPVKEVVRRAGLVF